MKLWDGKGVPRFLIVPPGDARRAIIREELRLRIGERARARVTARKVIKAFKAVGYGQGKRVWQSEFVGKTDPFRWRRQV